MVRTVCLSEDKHAVTMLRGLKQMKHEDDFCDFTIIVKGIEIPVHRNIIAVASPYFKAMLKHDTVESQQRKVEMKDVDFECVRNCIDFMYAGKFDIPDGKVAKLLHVAIMLQLDNIKQSICKILDEELKAENFYETKSIAERFNFLTLTAKCESYYKENLVAISAQPGFEVESKTHVIDIFPQLGLNEDDQLVVMLRWAGNDPTRKEDLMDFIKIINLSRVSLRCLSDILKNNSIINNDLSLHKLFSRLLVNYVDTNVLKVEMKCHGVGNLILFDQTANCLRTYNPMTSKVEMFRNRGFTHFGSFTATLMEPYIYVLCSNSSAHRLDIMKKTSRWERIPNMICKHGICPPCVSFSGSLYVIGFGDTSKATRDVESFDPATKQWLKLADKPEAACRTSLVSLGDAMYCVGGCNEGQSLNSFCKFKPSTSEWSDLPPMRNPRRSCCATTYGRKIYVAGGFRIGSENIQDVEVYDVDSQQWTTSLPLPNSIGFSVACCIGDWIFVCPRSAGDFSGFSDEIQRYDIVNDSWSVAKLVGVNRFRIYDCVLNK